MTTPAVPPVLTFMGNPTFAGNQVQIELTVTNYQAGLTFRLHRTSELAGLWDPDNAATFQEIVAGSRFRVTAVLSGASQEFYRGSARGLWRPPRLSPCAAYQRRISSQRGSRSGSLSAICLSGSRPPTFIAR